MINNDSETIACRFRLDDYIPKWETISGEPIGESMKWMEGENILYEMKRARLCSDQSCDASVRKDIFPLEAGCAAVSPDQKKYDLRLKERKCRYL